MTFNDFKLEYEKKTVINYPNLVKNNPLVSICITTFNHEKYIHQCIDSIISQSTKFDYEILIGEDESYDATREICIYYAKKYPERIRLFLHHRMNKIKINNVTTGRFNFLYNLFSAKGKYIAICDGDDYWIDPNKLNKQINFLQLNDNFSGVFTNGNIYYVESRKTQKKHYEGNKKEKYSLKDLLNGNPILTSSVLYRKAVVEKIGNKLNNIQVGDYSMHIFAAKFGYIGYLDTTSIVYRVHNEGSWQKMSNIEAIKSSIDIARQIKENLFLLKKKYHIWLINKYIGRLYIKLSDYYLRERKLNDSLRYSIKGFIYPLPNIAFRIKAAKLIIFNFKLFLKRNKDRY